MPRTTRQIIQIDEELCDGCGLCTQACPEGALRVIDGKARLVKESYCDGLGACLGDCPQGALTVVEMEVDAYDTEGVIAHLKQTAPELLGKHMAHLAAHGMSAGPASPAPGVAACPSVQVRLWEEESRPSAPAGRAASELRQWPVQLHLVPPRAPFFQGADLTLVADCVPFACPNFHADFLRDSAVAVGCPKLDDARAYVEKVAQILSASDIRSLRVAYMEVPCCRGLVHIAERALQLSGKDIPLESVMVTIDGEQQA